jgi:hypothetical protein
MSATKRERDRVEMALGAHRCLPIMKDDVIAYLLASDWKSDARELLYREWCKVVGVDVTRADLRRVQQFRRRELNRSLF